MESWTLPDQGQVLLVKRPPYPVTAVSLLSKFRTAEPAACWEGMRLFSFGVWRTGIVWELLADWGKMGKVSSAEYMQLLLLQAHSFLVSCCLFFSPPSHLLFSLVWLLLFFNSFWSLSFSLWFLLLSLILKIFMKAMFPYVFKNCWYSSIVFFIVFQAELKEKVDKKKNELDFFKFSKSSVWVKGKGSGQFLFLFESFPSK